MWSHLKQSAVMYLLTLTHFTVFQTRALFHVMLNSGGVQEVFIKLMFNV